MQCTREACCKLQLGCVHASLGYGGERDRGHRQKHSIGVRTVLVRTVLNKRYTYVAGTERRLKKNPQAATARARRRWTLRDTQQVDGPFSRPAPRDVQIRVVAWSRQSMQCCAMRRPEESSTDAPTRRGVNRTGQQRESMGRWGSRPGHRLTAWRLAVAGGGPCFVP